MIRSWWFESQSAPGVVFSGCIELLCLAAENIISLISVLTIWWCLCVELSLLLLWPVISHDKTRLAFALLHFVLQGQTYFHLPESLDFLLLHSNPLWWKGCLFLMLVLEDRVGRHRSHQPQLLQYLWLWLRLGLLWCWIVSLGREPRSFYHFWDCTRVLHFELFCCLRDHFG